MCFFSLMCVTFSAYCVFFFSLLCVLFFVLMCVFCSGWCVCFVQTDVCVFFGLMCTFFSVWCVCFARPTVCVFVRPDVHVFSTWDVSVLFSLMCSLFQHVVWALFDLLWGCVCFVRHPMDVHSSEKCCVRWGQNNLVDGAVRDLRETAKGAE